MAYLLDANVFISAKNLHYGFDFCPAFWDWLIEGHEAGRIFSVEKVGDEIRSVDDELSEWARERGPAFFRRPTEADFPSLAAVSRWAAGHGYEPSTVSTFLQQADYYLIAQAHAGGHTVVTHEVPAAGRRRIKIPRRLHRGGCQVYEFLRDIAVRAGAVRARTLGVSPIRRAACRTIEQEGILCPGSGRTMGGVVLRDGPARRGALNEE